MAYLTPADLAPFAEIDEAKAAAMIEDVEARARQAAPCIAEAEFMADADRMAAVRSILRQAVLRWNDAGTGVFTQMGAGPYQASTDTRSERKPLLWPSEISDLREICAAYSGGGEARAFSVRPSGSGYGVGPHHPWCALMMGANYCSCGADLTNYQYPLYEGGALS